MSVLVRSSVRVCSGEGMLLTCVQVLSVLLKLLSSRLGSVSASLLHLTRVTAPGSGCTPSVLSTRCTTVYVGCGVSEVVVPARLCGGSAMRLSAWMYRVNSP